MNSLKDQAIDSGMKIATDALRGEDMEESLQQELQHVKRKIADRDESVIKMKYSTFLYFLIRNII